MAEGDNDRSGRPQPASRLAEAEAHLRRALAEAEARHGPHHPGLAIILNDLALLLWKSNRLVRADRVLVRVLRILVRSTRATGQPHPDLRAALRNYGGLCIVRQVPEQEVWLRLFRLFNQGGVEDDQRDQILAAAFQE
jgi:hypothetical protein